jgi:hypothetical protein
MNVGTVVRNANASLAKVHIVGRGLQGGGRHQPGLCERANAGSGQGTMPAVTVGWPCRR